MCPWLGTEEDSTVRHAEPDEAHRCHAQKPPAPVTEEFQAEFCLVSAHVICPFYLKPPPTRPLAPLADASDEEGPPVVRPGRLRLLLWIFVAVAAIVVVFVYGRSLLRAPTVQPTALPGVSPSPTLTFTPTPLATVSVPSATPGFIPPTATPTPYPGGAIYSLSPEVGAAGWVASDEARGNHLGDSYLYAGVWDGVIYHGIFQMDLSSLPRGATLHAGVLELTGLDARRLGAAGVWEVRILGRDADENWNLSTYQEVHNAAVEWSLPPALAPNDLAAGKTTGFRLPAELLRDLEQRVLDQYFSLSFRLDGPFAGVNSVFAWDSGFGSASRGSPPRLLLNVGPPPKTPIPTGTPPFVVVTSTPTPANVLTAAAHVRTAIAQAFTTGTPTPTSVYQWTATPVHVVTNTPTPANKATADYYVEFMTAVALTTGTFTPTPPYLVTATPTPVRILERDLTPTPTSPPAPPVPAVPGVLKGEILFLSNRAGSANPWCMNPDGSQVALLTAPWPYDAAASREVLSQDGGRVAYVGTADGKAALLERPARGGTGRVVFVAEFGQVASPAWSPAADLIAFVWDGQVWVVNADGSGLAQLTQKEWGTASHPTFSPDGARLAYAGTMAGSGRQIWVMALDGTGRTNLSRNGYDERDPVWVK